MVPLNCLRPSARIFIESNRDLPTCPMVEIPGVAVAAVAIWIIRARPSVESLVTAAPILLCLSLFLGPYGWFWDQAVLLPIQFLVAGVAVRTGRVLPIVALVTFHVAVLTIIHLVPNATAILALHPLALLGLYFWCARGELSTSSGGECRIR